MDNANKEIFYEGAYWGDPGTDTDILLFASLDLAGIPWSVYNGTFYISLLAESYTLYREQKYKLALFTAYSAFESFINSKHATPTKDGEHLADTIKEVYRAKSSNYADHQIYTSLRGTMNKIREARNAVAHGRIEETKENESLEALIFAFTMITYWQHSITTFSQVYQILKEWEYLNKCVNF